MKHAITSVHSIEVIIVKKKTTFVYVLRHQKEPLSEEARKIRQYIMDFLIKKVT